MYYTVAATLALLLLAFWIYARREAKRHGTSAKDEAAGICLTATERTTTKNRNKATIMDLLDQGSELSNSDIREHLDVTSRSVRNYMNELIAEGHAKQVGDMGRSVTYRKP